MKKLVKSNYSGQDIIDLENRIKSAEIYLEDIVSAFHRLIDEGRMVEIDDALDTIIPSLIDVWKKHC